MLYRKVFPREYLSLCPNESERKRIVRAEGLVDFVELGRYGGGVLRNERDLQSLYAHLFPNPNERIPWDRLVEAMGQHDGAQWKEIARLGFHARMHALAALREGRVVGISFFKSMRMDCQGYLTGLMYSGVADRAYAKAAYGIDRVFRGAGITDAFYLLSHGITLEDAESDGRKNVFGTIGDCELIGQGLSKEHIRFTKMRLDIHARHGLLPVMFETGPGCWVTPVVQPSLGNGRVPLVMHMLFKPFSPGFHVEEGMLELDRELVGKLVRAYIRSYDSLENEPEAIAFARDAMITRLEAARRMMIMHPDALPDIGTLAGADPLLRAQIERDFGDLKTHLERVRDALG
ncbi:MAG: hypothetical protein V1861_06895 [Candidatus Micrarchaeota archaeon]